MLNVYQFYDNPKELTLDPSDKFPVDILYWHITKFLGHRWTKVEPLIMKDPWYAYKYAKEILANDPKWVKQSGHENGRWKEAEPYIATSPKSAYAYATEIIRGRFPEAEPYILKSSDVFHQYIYPYIQTVLAKDQLWTNISGHENGRWPEAELIIMKDPLNAYWYAADVIQGRWVEAEPYIKQSDKMWKQYCKKFKVPKSER